MLEIPNELGRGIAQIIQQWKQDEHDQKTNVDNVQILERMAIGRKDQMIELTEEGSMKLQQCEMAEREKEQERSGVFFNSACGEIHGQITERMQEMGPYIDQDVVG